MTGRMLAVALLIVGNLIGAGILALPIQTGLAGWWPSAFGLLVTGLAMYYSAVVLSREAATQREPTFNYPSLFGRHLGPLGKWVATLANLLLLYGLLTAYLTGGTSILMGLFALPVSGKVVLLGFWTVATALAAGNLAWLERYNGLLVVLMVAAFMALAILAGSHVHPDRLAHRDWPFLPCAIPIMVTAFHFHNIIPTVCERLNWNHRAIWKSMLLGMILGFLLNAVWILVGVGSLPLDASEAGLVTAFEKNLPATVPLAQMVHTPLFTSVALAFALIAILTSYMANGVGLLGFATDFLVHHAGRDNRLLAKALTFLPPLVIGLIYPDLFLKAIDVAGGVGIVTLFGILPAVLAWRQAATRGSRGLAAIMFVLFTAFLLFEIGQKTGLLRMKPSTESWETGAVAPAAEN
jgi:tyrosine-specific transport protein